MTAVWIDLHAPYPATPRARRPSHMIQQDFQVPQEDIDRGAAGICISGSLWMTLPWNTPRTEVTICLAAGWTMKKKLFFLIHWCPAPSRWDRDLHVLHCFITLHAEVWENECRAEHKRQGTVFPKLWCMLLWGFKLISTQTGKKIKMDKSLQIVQSSRVI